MLAPLAAQISSQAPQPAVTRVGQTNGMEDLSEAVKDLQAQLKHLQLILERVTLRNSPSIMDLNRVTPTTPRANEPGFASKWREARRAYDAGMRAEDQLRWAAAIEEYTKAIAVDPTNDVAYLHRGAALAELGETALALADLSESIRLQPNNTRAYELRAVAFYGQGAFNEAITDLDEAIKRAPRTAASYVQRARTLQKTNQLHQALDDYTTALSIEGTAQTYIERARLNLTLGFKDRAMSDCSEAIDTDPKMEQGYLCRAVTLLAMNRSQEAVVDLQEALALRPTFSEAQALLELSRVIARPKTGGEVLAMVGPPLPPPTPSPKANPVQVSNVPPATLTPLVAAPVAEKETVSGNHPAAVDPKLRARQKEAFNLTIKGRALVGKGKLQDALALYDQAIELDPQLALAYNSRGYVHLKLQDYKSAVEDFNNALRYHPSYENARFNLAIAQQQINAKVIPSQSQ